MKILCFRNPQKEADILTLTKGNPDFMQGEWFLDEKGNNIRVLDIVRGRNLFVDLGNMAMDHETYFEKVLPEILEKLIPAFEAIRFLHSKGLSPRRHPKRPHHEGDKERPLCLG